MLRRSPPFMLVILVMTLWLSGRMIVVGWYAVPSPALDAPPPDNVPLTLVQSPAALDSVTAEQFDPATPAMPSVGGHIVPPVALPRRISVPHATDHSIAPSLAATSLSPTQYRQMQRLFFADTRVRHRGFASGGVTTRPVAMGQPMWPARAGDIMGGEWSGSAWLAPRQGGITDASPAGPTLGGSQAGGRIALQLDQAGHWEGYGRIVTAGRLVSAAEAAVGVAWQPRASLPLRLAVERRQRIVGDNGRSALSAYVVGGVSDAALPAGWRLDGYGAAGVVGAHRRDGFAEASLRVTRPLVSLGALHLSGGAGGWAAAQPGVSRIDVGPTISARIDHVGPRLSLDWRQRITGNAAPDSGAALTIAADF